MRTYIDQKSEIKSHGFKRILNFLIDNNCDHPLIDGTLNLFTKAISKTKFIDFYFFRVYRVLKQPPNEVKDFIEQYNQKNNNSYITGNLSMNRIKTFTSLNFNSKKDFLISLADIFSYLADQDIDVIDISFKNIDMILKSNDTFFNNYVTKNFNINSNGIDSLFDCLNIIQSNFEKLRPYINTEDKITNSNEFLD